MKSFDEIRAEAWKTLREGGWVLKFVVVWLAMLMLVGFVQGLWNSAVTSMGIQTWTAFLEAKFKAMSSGLDFTVPSHTVALRMWEATAFEMFVSCIVNGIITFAVARLFLRAAQGVRERWFAASFGGFRYPLGVAWLYFRYSLQVGLWSLLLIVPGIVAAYRYCQCWNIKVEHPDWSAGKCLAESGRMMDGQKWNRFKFDFSYWKPITLVLSGLLILSVLLAIASLGTLPKAFGVALSVAFVVISAACIWGGVVLATYMSIGQAKFYLEIKDDLDRRSSDQEVK